MEIEDLNEKNNDSYDESQRNDNHDKFDFSDQCDYDLHNDSSRNKISTLKKNR